VDFLVDTGITAGCGPLLYCPDRAVTRGEQAVFLKKFLTVGSMPQVVDASGRLLGRTTTVTDSFATVALSIQNRLIFVPVAPGGFQNTFFPGLFYPGVSNCSGPGFFISVSAFAPASPAKVVAPGHTAYVADFANPQMFSGATGSADGLGGGCNPTPPPPFTGTGFPAIPLVDLDTLGFQTPFGLL
jgi:hypothetical protein